MEMNVFIYFIICSILVVGGVFVIGGIVVHEYVRDYHDDECYPFGNYIGYFALISVLYALCFSLFALIFSLMCGISEYDLSLLGMFLKSDVFKLILLTCIGGEGIYLYILFNHYCFFDTMSYRNVENKICGIKDVLRNSEEALEKLDRDIKKAEKDESSKGVLRELQNNRNSLAKDLENYSIKQVHLKTIKTKLENKLREKNMF